MTSSADERWILCGGANHASAPEDALRLAVSGSDANLTVDIEGLATNLIANIPPVMKDLVRVASYESEPSALDHSSTLRWRAPYRAAVGALSGRGEVMKFKAEQFEAEVTEVGNDQWVIVAQGAKPKSLRINSMRDQLQFLTDRGWTELCDSQHVPTPDSIALAISLLYSVPGVRVEEESTAEHGSVERAVEIQLQKLADMAGDDIDKWVHQKAARNND